MLRSIMVHVLGFFVAVGVLAVLAFLQAKYGHDFRHHPAPGVSATATSSALRVSRAGVDEVDSVLLQKLQRGELSCVDGYVSALSMENGVARAYVIQTSTGPVHCYTKNRQGVRTSL